VDAGHDRPIGPLVDARCPDCASEQAIEYIMRGAPSPCRACGRIVLMQNIPGRVLPNTWFALTFARALALLRYADAPDQPDLRLGSRRAQVQEVVGKLGFRLRGADAATEVLDGSGTRQDPLVVHRMIQADPDLQYALYQIDMDLGHQGW
jgi:ribosomal protein S27E